MKKRFLTLALGLILIASIAIAGIIQIGGQGFGSGMTVGGVGIQFWQSATTIAYDLKALFTAANQTFSDAQILDTAAEGVETGSLTVVDTSTGAVKIVGNELELVGSGGWNTTGFYDTTGITRSLGKGGFLNVNSTGAGQQFVFGFNQTAAIDLNLSAGFFISSAEELHVYWNQVAVVVGTIVTDTDYQTLLLLGGYDSSGVPFKTGDTVGDFLYGAKAFIKGGTFTNWTLVWSDKRNNDATLYYSFDQITGAGSLSDNLLIPTLPLDPDIMFQPNFLDTFTGTNDDQLVSALTPEVVAGATGSGNPWESGGTTWTIQSNAAVNTGYVGTLNTSFLSDDIAIVEGLYDVSITGTDVKSGIVSCLDDKDSPANYIETYYDFSDSHVKCVKTVGGAPTGLIDVAKAYSAGAQLRVIISDHVAGTSLKLKVYYNNALIGTEQTISNAGIADNTRQGILSTSTTNSLDNFTVNNRTNAAWDTLITESTGGIY